jgi:hypothetical protein
VVPIQLSPFSGLRPHSPTVLTSGVLRASTRPSRATDARQFIARYLDQLPPNVIPYVRQAFANYQRGIWFDCFGW